ncbi:hypothetical protein D9M72_619870 [compost metagenome]
MFEDFSSEMVSQVALFLLIAIASGLLFDTSAVSLGRSGRRVEKEAGSNGDE